MTRKHFDQMAGIVRDLGLAAVIGGVGDLVINRAADRQAIDLWGILCGFGMLVTSVYLAGVDLRRRGAVR